MLELMMYQGTAQRDTVQWAGSQAGSRPSCSRKGASNEAPGMRRNDVSARPAHPWK